MSLGAFLYITWYMLTIYGTILQVPDKIFVLWLFCGFIGFGEWAVYSLVKAIKSLRN